MAGRAAPEPPTQGLDRHRTVTVSNSRRFTSANSSATVCAIGSHGSESPGPWQHHSSRAVALGGSAATSSAVASQERCKRLGTQAPV